MFRYKNLFTVLDGTDLILLRVEPSSKFLEVSPTLKYRAIAPATWGEAIEVPLIVLTAFGYVLE